jgi:hypothetical protein
VRAKRYRVSLALADHGMGLNNGLRRISGIPLRALGLGIVWIKCLRFCLTDGILFVNILTDFRTGAVFEWERLNRFALLRRKEAIDHDYL